MPFWEIASFNRSSIALIQEKQGKISKLASLIARKADKISDKISDSLSLHGKNKAASSTSMRSRQSSCEGGGGGESAGRGSFESQARSSPPIPVLANAQPPTDRLAAAAAAAAAAAKSAAAALSLPSSATPSTPSAALSDLKTAATGSPLAPDDVHVSSSSGMRSTSPFQRRRSSSGGASDPAAQPPPLDPVSQDDSSPSWAGESLGMHEFEVRPSRKGLYLQLLGEQVEVIGEKGTKVSLSFNFLAI